MHEANLIRASHANGMNQANKKESVEEKKHYEKGAESII